MTAAKHLKSKVMHGALWSFFASSGYQILGLLIFVMLSRSLTPADFGMMAVAIIFIDVLRTVVRMGMLESIVREKELSEEVTNSIFWVTFFVGVFFSGVVYLSSGIIASLFNMPVLADILKLLSFLPTLHALSTVHEGLLLRNYQFKSLAFRTLIATSLSGTVAVILALNGFGLYSLVLQRILGVLVLTSLLWYYMRWSPRFIFSVTEAKRMVFTGFPIMLQALLGVGNYKVVNICVGLFLGPTALGLLHLAGKLHDFLLQFTIKPLADVALTTFSSLQSNRKELTKAYRRLTQFCGVMAIPAFLGLVVVAPELIGFVFGEQWEGAILLTQIMCLTVLSSILNFFFKALMIAIGEGKVVLKVGILQFVLTSFTVLITSQISIVAVLIGFFVVHTVITFVILWQAQHKLSVQISQVIKDFTPAVLTTVVMVLSLLAIRFFVGDSLEIITFIVISVLLGVLFYVGGLFVFFPTFVQQMKESFLPTILERFKRNK